MRNLFGNSNCGSIVAVGLGVDVDVDVEVTFPAGEVPVLLSGPSPVMGGKTSTKRVDVGATVGVRVALLTCGAIRVLAPDPANLCEPVSI